MKALKLETGSVSIVDIDNNDKAIHEAIGGTIEHIKMHGGGVMICDKSGIDKKLLHNDLASYISGHHVYGTALIVGTTGDKYCDVPEWYFVWLGN